MKYLQADSFNILVNTALLFNLAEVDSDLAADALLKAKFSINNMEDPDKSFSLNSGLAIVAAVTRGTKLANTLRVLARVLRRREQFNFDPNNELRIAMIAAASFEHLDDWARFVGEWITEVAFEYENKGAGKLLLMELRRLIQIEPTLTKYCAAADAAFASLNS